MANSKLAENKDVAANHQCENNAAKIFVSCHRKPFLRAAITDLARLHVSNKTFEVQDDKLSLFYSVLSLSFVLSEVF